jgi:hypothetical protein
MTTDSADPASSHDATRERDADSGSGEVALDPAPSVDRGARVVSRASVVNAPAPEIFALLANPHRHHEVDGSGTVRPAVIGPRDLRLGDRFAVSMKMYGVPYRMTNTVTEWEQDRLIAWQHIGRHTWRWELSPQPDGTTLVTESFDYTTSRAPAVYEWVRMPALNSHSIRASLRRLQDRYPGSAGTPPAK